MAIFVTINPNDGFNIVETRSAVELEEQIDSDTTDYYESSIDDIKEIKSMCEKFLK